MNLMEFESFCRKVATQYAKSDGQYSGSYFMKTENITRDCFYKVLDEAVIRNLISEELVDQRQFLNKKVMQQRLENHQNSIMQCLERSEMSISYAYILTLR